MTITAYSKKLLEHFKNPKHVGEIKNPSAVAEVGNIQCGDVMKIFMKIKDGKIEDIKFKTYGCAAAIASIDVLCDLVKGKTIDEALNLKYSDVLKELGEVPKHKVHCSVLSIETLKKAIKEFLDKSEKK